MTTSTTTPDAATTTWRITMFFNWFRQRSANAASLTGSSAPPLGGQGAGSYLPEQHLIVTASLDALAGFWAKMYLSAAGGKAPSHAMRMGEFLVRHGTPGIFTRVSGPDVLRRGRSGGKSGLTAPQQDALLRAVPDDAATCRVRRWTEDPDLDVLAAKLAPAGISRAWLESSRYGELIYRYHRCNWVHEVSGHPELAPEPPLFSPDELGYENFGTGTVRRRLALPFPFLRATLDRAISSFEQQCLTDGRDPCP